jgi:iron-chelate-transporting ATPase
MSDPGAQLRGIDLHLAYHGVEVVGGASIRLHGGRVTALVGPNGSGKSTLLRSLARLHRPTAGDVVLDDDTSAADLSPKAFARRVTLLAQSRPTPAGISVRDVVGYGRHPYRGRWRAHDPGGSAAVAWAMDVTGIEAMADRSVDELSGGELQRVWLATSLAQQTDVLLLDEPTTFLDLRYQMEILDLLPTTSCCSTEASWPRAVRPARYSPASDSPRRTASGSTSAPIPTPGWSAPSPLAGTRTVPPRP